MKDGFWQSLIRGLLIGFGILLAYVIDQFVSRNAGVFAAFALGCGICWLLIYLRVGRWL